MNTTQILRTMLIHTCDIVQLSRSTVSSGSYGHKRVLENATPTKTYSNVQCRCMPISEIEQQMQGTLGKIIADFDLFVVNADLVSELQTIMSAVIYYQVQNIRSSRKGSVLWAGPFDINGIVDETGEEHHWKLQLRRVA